MELLCYKREIHISNLKKETFSIVLLFHYAQRYLYNKQKVHESMTCTIDKKNVQFWIISHHCRFDVNILYDLHFYHHKHMFYMISIFIDNRQQVLPLTYYITIMLFLPISMICPNVPTDHSVIKISIIRFHFLFHSTFSFGTKFGHWKKI